MAIKVAGQEVISDTRKITGAIGLDLTPIEATIADTAVDVFVYDTRKDSDGGAWRKRTQHTSWYNETLNTATRGSRKEFPAVAVIVADNVNHTVTIYDGDDPDLPMWMVFSDWDYRPTNRMIGSGDNGTLTACLAMLNGKLAVGVEGSAGSAGSWDGLFEIDFLKDHSVHRNITSTTYGVWDGNISTRNTGGYPATNSYSVAGIVNTQVNDIAMTVLPNAPIDPATQLPIPTIAVATDGGVSVIKDDGSVVDSSDVSSQVAVIFTEEGVWGSSDTTLNFGTYAELSSDSFGQTYVASTALTQEIDLATRIREFTSIKDGWAGGNSLSTTKGVQLCMPTYSNLYDSSICVINSTYNTGWMNGDIKLATLSDTDATNVTGTELVTNGTFDSNITGWSGDGTSTVAWNSSGYIDVDRNGGGVSSGRVCANAPISGLVVGKRYVVTADCISASDSVSVDVYETGLTTSMSPNPTLYSAGDVVKVGFTATATSGYVCLGCRGSIAATATFDNVSVRLAEDDRSTNGSNVLGNGLQVFGTVTKTPVATGADLVAYSGFSASNYFKAPAIPAFNTGDYFASTWAYFDGTDDNYHHVVSIGEQQESTGVTLKKTRGGVDDAVYFYGNGTTLVSTGVDVPTNTWIHLAGGRRNGVWTIYVNGKLTATGATNNFGIGGSGTTKVTVGFNEGVGSNEVFANNKQALVRLSATFPTAEQIAKIYEDEKVLFQEGAQATLYGSSDAVTALAYDDTTDLLHVGTSAGRSDFSGLRRVSNTTDAVGVALSASNGMIVEE